MGYYGRDWALKILSRWEEANPRVVSMIDRFVSWTAELGVRDPRKYVEERLLYLLMNSRGNSVWGKVKGGAKSQISWKPIYQDYIRPIHPEHWQGEYT